MLTRPAAPLTGILLFLLMPFFLRAQCDKLDFKYEYALKCFPAMVKFTASGAPEGSVYYWDFGKGYITGSDIQYEYIDKEGVYSVGLQVKLPDGTICTKYKANLLDIRELGKPGFMANQLKFCSLPGEAELTDTTRSSVKRRWQINGQWISDTGRILKYTFTEAGYYSIGLEARSASGCTSFGIKEKIIHIEEGLKADFCALISHVGNGVPDSITLNALPLKGVSPVKYIWQIGAATYSGAEPHAKFSIQGIDSADVTLTIHTAEGCTLSQAKKNLIQSYGNASIRELCMKQRGKLTWLGQGSGRNTGIQILSEPASTVTQISNEAYELHFSDDGNADVRVKFKYDHSACEDEVLFKSLYTIKPINPELTVRQTRLCKPGTVTFTPMPQLPATEAKYSWVIQDSLNDIVFTGVGATFSYDFKKEGRYHLYLVIHHTNGCTNDKLFKDAVIIGAPTPDFTFNTACAGEKVSLKNLTVPPGSDENLYLHHWTVKNRDSVKASYIGLDANPEITLSTPGIYDVTYEASVVLGCSKKTTRQMTVNGIVANFTYTKPGDCLPASSILKANVQLNQPGAPLSYFWEVLPAGKAVIVSQGLATTELTIKEKGCFTIRLTISSASGCSTIIEKPNICAGVTAAFRFPQKVCPGKQTFAYNSSKNAGSFKWIVSPSQGVTISPSATDFHTNISFAKDGDYVVTLVAKSDSGTCIDTFKVPVKVQTTKATFKAADSIFYCAPSTVRFSSTGSLANSYLWFWGDGTSSTTTDTVISKTYSTNRPSGYTVTLVAQGPAGCNDTIKRENYIRISGPAPRFAMSTKKACGDANIHFMDSSEFVGGYIMQYGDGSPVVTSLSGSHHYPYTDYSKDSIALVPTMFAIDKASCLAVFRDTLVLYRPPQAGFEVKTYEGCAPFTAKFINTSAYGSQFEWDFDNDGNVDDQSFSPSYTFTKPGKYTITLNVKNKQCSDFVRKEAIITVYDKPETEISILKDSICYTEAMNFYGNLLSGSEINVWNWDFDDGLGSFPSGEQVAYKFNRPGPHKVRLIAMNYYGCTDTVYKNVFVRDSTPPKAAEILVVTPLSPKQFKIEWQQSTNPNFSGYELYKNDELIFSAQNIDATSYIFPIPDVVPTEVDNYRLITLDPCGLKAKSMVHNNIVVSAKQLNELSIEISWNEYKGWDKNLIQYEIYRKKGKAKSYTLYKKLAGTSTSYIDTPICDEGYSYYIRAVSADGYASISNEKSILPVYTYQETPIGFSFVTVEYDDSIRLNWDRSIQKNVEHYIIDRYRPDLGWQESYAMTSDTSFVDKSTDVDVMSYSYRVQVQDKCGNLSPKSKATASILLQVNIKNDKRHLSWNTYKGWSSGVEGYMVELKDNKGRYRVIGYNNAEDTLFVDDSLYSIASDGTCYRVTALQNAPAHLQEVSLSNTFCNDLEPRIYVPTAFTPGNADSLNEVWRVYSISIARNFKLSIFNRWGEEVYSSNRLEDGWNGTIKGSPAPAGEYVYILSGQTVQGSILRQKGKFYLLR